MVWDLFMTSFFRVGPRAAGMCVHIVLPALTWMWGNVLSARHSGGEKQEIFSIINNGSFIIWHGWNVVLGDKILDYKWVSLGFERVRLSLSYKLS